MDDDFGNDEIFGEENFIPLVAQLTTE